MSISGIFLLLLCRFWANFKGRILGPYANCHLSRQHLSNQEYLKKILTQNFWTKIFFKSKLVLTTNFTWINLVLTFFSDQNFLDPQFILALNFFFFKFFFNPNFFSRSKIFLVQKFLDQTFYWVQKKCWTKIFSDQNFFRPKFFGTKFFVKIFFLTQIFFSKLNTLDLVLLFTLLMLFLML